MSPLNNQATDITRNMLVDLVRVPGSRIGEEDAHALGLDIEMLEALFEADVKPYLDNVLGYRDLLDLDPLAKNWRWNFADHAISWHDVLKRHRLASGNGSRHRQVARVLQDELPCDQLSRRLNLTIYLTREGKWIVWHVDVTVAAHEPVGDEVMHIFPDLKKMFDYLSGIAEKAYYRNGGPMYVPLQLAHGLMRLTKETIDKKREYLDSFEKAYADGMARIETIKPKSR